MKKPEPEDEMRPSYQRSDFSRLERGKYAARLADSSNVVMVEPDLARAFPNEEAVNNALRGLLELADTTARLTRQTGRRSG